MWWSRNDHGVWCDACGELIWPEWFEEYENGEEPEYCPSCRASEGEWDPYEH